MYCRDTGRVSESNGISLSRPAPGRGGEPKKPSPRMLRCMSCSNSRRKRSLGRPSGDHAESWLVPSCDPSQSERKECRWGSRISLRSERSSVDAPKLFSSRQRQRKVLKALGAHKTAWRSKMCNLSALSITMETTEEVPVGHQATLVASHFPSLRTCDDDNEGNLSRRHSISDTRGESGTDTLLSCLNPCNIPELVWVIGDKKNSSEPEPEVLPRKERVSTLGESARSNLVLVCSHSIGSR